jgi:ferritin
MISAKMQDAFNEQINKELYSEYLYLAMAGYFDSLGLKGFANWMRVQVKEERTHAMMMYTYVNEVGGRARMLPIEGPPNEWDSPLAAFEHVLEHEQFVTSRIHNLVNMATEEKDHASIAFLQWFVTEQVEEEASATEIGLELKLIGDNGQGLLMKDRELATRVFTLPAEAVGAGVI